MTLSMSRIPKEKMGNATSLFNLMRNIGGSCGIAIMTTFLARRTQMHQNRLAPNIAAGDSKTQATLQQMQAWFHAHGADNYTAARKALATTYGMVQTPRRHAFVRRSILDHGRCVSRHAAVYRSAAKCRQHPSNAPRPGRQRADAGKSTGVTRGRSRPGGGLTKLTSRIFLAGRITRIPESTN